MKIQAVLVFFIGLFKIQKINSQHAVNYPVLPSIEMVQSTKISFTTSVFSVYTHVKRSVNFAVWGKKCLIIFRSLKFLLHFLFFFGFKSYLHSFIKTYTFLRNTYQKKIHLHLNVYWFLKKPPTYTIIMAHNLLY